MARASERDIESPKAFLITIVSRLCINYLEEYVGEWLPEPLVTDATSGSADAVEAGESVSMALLLLLERLTPSERAAEAVPTSSSVTNLVRQTAAWEGF